ncbi:MAG: Smr/MutS family protein [Leeuwenhoekiella sp.]
MGSFKKGQKVTLINDILTGTVSRVDGMRVWIETSDGFEIETSHDEIILVSDEMSAHLDFSDIDAVIKEKEFKKKRSQRVKPKERSLPPMEVDLHIHHLAQSTKGMSNHDMLKLQIDTARRQLEFAMQKRIQKVVFIHGVGEGVLRTELEYLFSRYENIKFYDADYSKYGLGATEIYIYQNPV